MTGWNPAAEQLFGYTQSEAIGQEMAELIIPERLRARHREGLLRYLRSGKETILGKRIEMPALTKNRGEISVELNVTRIPVGASPSFTGFLRDITALKHAENERNQQQAAQRLLDQATVALAGSLDIAETIEKAARFAFPASRPASVELVGEAGDLGQAAAAHGDPEKEALARRLGREVLPKEVLPQIARGSPPRLHDR